MSVTANGKIKKKTYCPNCFSIVNWDEATDEKSLNGRRVVECPNCGVSIDITNPHKVTIEEPTEE